MQIRRLSDAKADLVLPKLQILSYHSFLGTRFTTPNGLVVY